MKTPATILLILSLAFAPVASLNSNPINPEIISGSVEFPEEFTDLLEISQHSDKAIIHWEGFSIDSGEITRFIQPDSSATVLNRVVSGNTSNIEGALEANGGVLLINPNGILFGAGARVDTNGFIASTLDVPDAEFLAGGDMRFSGASQAPVVNLGEIKAENGDVFLVGATVQNAGDISAPNGTVGLAAGQQVLITKEGDERVFVEVGSNGSVDHSGAIRSAAAELKAAGGNPKAMAVNVRGVVEATGVQRRGGRVFLGGGGGQVRVSSKVRARHDDGAGGAIQVSGAKVEMDANADLDASGTVAGEVNIIGQDQVRILGSRIAAKSDEAAGGRVEVLSEAIEIGSGSRLLAHGATAGGEVVVGGDLRNGIAQAQTVEITDGADLRANATVDGRGGHVAAFAFDSVHIGGAMTARGRVSGDGGTVDVFGGDLTLTQTSNLDASGGVNGGFITIEGGDIVANGRIATRGATGDGGFIFMKGEGDISVGSTARFDASGETNGGFIAVEGEDDVAVHGQLRARGATGDGGQILVSGEGDVTVGQTALLDASGEVNGGFVNVQGGGDVVIDGQLRAVGITGDGGQILVSGEGDVSVGETARLDASGGANGGFVHVDGGGDVSIGGLLLARGGSGEGGQIQVTGDGNVDVAATALLDVSGATGGVIFVDSPNSTTVNGSMRAEGTVGAGGHIEVTGNEVTLGGTATLSVDGIGGGGQILVGGDFQGENPDVRNAQNTLVEAGAQISADSLAAGDAGRVIVWADGNTLFTGHASAAADGASGDGGFIEISGKTNLGYSGTVDARSLTGEFGHILFDPAFILITLGAQGAAANSGALNDRQVLAGDGGNMATYVITKGDVEAAAQNGSVLLQASDTISNGGIDIDLFLNGNPFTLDAPVLDLADTDISNPGGAVNIFSDMATLGNINTAGALGENGGDVMIDVGTGFFGDLITDGGASNAAFNIQAGDAGDVSFLDPAGDITVGTLQGVGGLVFDNGFIGGDGADINNAGDLTGALLAIDGGPPIGGGTEGNPGTVGGGGFLDFLLFSPAGIAPPAGGGGAGNNPGIDPSDAAPFPAATPDPVPGGDLINSPFFGGNETGDIFGIGSESMENPFDSIEFNADAFVQTIRTIVANDDETAGTIFTDFDVPSFDPHAINIFDLLGANPMIIDPDSPSGVNLDGFEIHPVQGEEADDTPLINEQSVHEVLFNAAVAGFVQNLPDFEVDPNNSEEEIAEDILDALENLPVDDPSDLSDSEFFFGFGIDSEEADSNESEFVPDFGDFEGSSFDSGGETSPNSNASSDQRGIFQIVGATFRGGSDNSSLQDGNSSIGSPGFIDETEKMKKRRDARRARRLGTERFQEAVNRRVTTIEHLGEMITEDLETGDGAQRGIIKVWLALTSGGTTNTFDDLRVSDYRYAEFLIGAAEEVFGTDEAGNQANADFLNNEAKRMENEATNSQTGQDQSKRLRVMANELRTKADELSQGREVSGLDLFE